MGCVYIDYLHRHSAAFGIINGKYYTDCEINHWRPLGITTKATEDWIRLNPITYLIASCMGSTWGPPGADRAQVGPMVAPWILLSGLLTSWNRLVLPQNRHNQGPFCNIAFTMWRTLEMLDQYTAIFLDRKNIRSLSIGQRLDIFASKQVA